MRHGPEHGQGLIWLALGMVLGFRYLGLKNGHSPNGYERSPYHDFADRMEGWSWPAS
jgi:hypothetical protein